MKFNQILNIQMILAEQSSVDLIWMTAEKNKSEVENW